MAIKSPSTLAQLAANSVPIVGLLFWHWSIGDILLLFWVEAAIICFYTLLMLGVVERWKFIFMGPFAAFVFAHVLLFLLAVIDGVSIEIFRVSTGAYQKRDYMEIARDLLPALAAFFISHGVAFLFDFLGKRQYQTRDSAGIATKFLRELLPLGASAIIAVFIVTVFGNVVILFAVALLVKIGLDTLIQVSEADRR